MQDPVRGNSLSFHYRPEKGWINDPNGLVWFKGYYHIFYQHAPHFETPWHESMHWGHARTKDFIRFEELPVALFPDRPYDKDGCWSGTAIVKDDVLYLFYSGICGEQQAVCAAYSEDGILFEKLTDNPVIPTFPSDGSPDFRDPAVCFADGKLRCVMASGNRERHSAVLLLYDSDDLIHWQYHGVLCEWENAKFAECPSFLRFSDRYLLAASVCKEDGHRFSVMIGDFSCGRFTPEATAELDKGPDQYAGQMFSDPNGRAILIAWIPGWSYAGFRERDIGCMSVPRQIHYRDGKLFGFPIKELQSFLRDDDPAIQRTADGYRIERQGRDCVTVCGDIRKLDVLRDGYVLEVFVNDGEEIYTVLL